MTSGIYKIINIQNGKCYIGSSKNLKKRLNGHRRSLTKCDHHSILLQRSWNKYGEENFEFEIIEECSIDVLLEREQHWMDETKCYDKKFGYNILPNAGSSVGRKVSEKTKKKLSIAAKMQKSNRFRMKGKNSAAYGKRHSIEWKEMMSDRMAGNKNPFYGRKHSEETKRKIGNTNKDKSAGSKSKLSKINEDMVKEILEKYRTGIYTQKELGSIYGIDQTNVSLIVTGKSWKHVKREE